MWFQLMADLKIIIFAKKFTIKSSTMQEEQYKPMFITMSSRMKGKK